VRPSRRVDGPAIRLIDCEFQGGDGAARVADMSDLPAEGAAMDFAADKVNGGSAGAGPVIILDQLTLPSAVVDSWVERLRAEYLPAAIGRGLRLVGIWSGYTRHPGYSTVVAQWQLPSAGAFWACRRRAMTDPGVDAFWAATDAIALARERRVLKTVEEP
jgi:hypothetical protein